MSAAFPAWWEDAKRLSNQGCSMRVIAEKLDATIWKVRRALSVMSGETPPSPADYQPARVISRNFLPAEDAIIREMANRGFTHATIAGSLVNRTTPSVVRRMQTLGIGSGAAQRMRRCLNLDCRGEFFYEPARENFFMCPRHRGRDD